MTLEAIYFLPHPPLAVPEIGRGQEERIADTLAAFKEVAQRVVYHNPDIIVVISPHSAYYSDWIYVASGERAQGSFSDFGRPELRFSLEYDDMFRRALINEAEKQGIPAGEVSRFARDLDHGIMVPLYFIEKRGMHQPFRVVSIGGSGLDDDKLLRFGRCIADVASAMPERVVLLVSGDLSHKLIPEGPYGYDPAGPAFDSLFKEIIQKNMPLEFADIPQSLRRDAAECGLSGFIMCAGALDELQKAGIAQFDSELLSYEGPFGVGYGIAAFEKRGA